MLATSDTCTLTICRLSQAMHKEFLYMMDQHLLLSDRVTSQNLAFIHTIGIATGSIPAYAARRSDP